MQWASAISQAARLEDALDEALDTALAHLAGSAPDLFAVFASPDYLTHASRLAPHLAHHCPDATLIGCSAAGVIGGGHEIEQERGLALVAAALPGVRLQTFHVDGEAARWPDDLDPVPDDARAFVLLPDPLTCPTEHLLRWLDRAYPDVVKIGGLASGGFSPGSMALFHGGATAWSGAVGLALAGDIDVATVVAQGCRPVGPPVFATRIDDNRVLELDGRPAIRVLESLYNQITRSDQELFNHSLFLGLVMDSDKQEYQRGDYLIRNIVGIEPDTGAIAVTGEISDNQVVQFHLRDAETSAADLHDLLGRHAGPAPAGALLFSCLGRGQGLYGVPDHDTRAFGEHFTGIPVGGFFCNGEIGPVGRRTFLHGYTSSLGLFSPGR